MFLTQDQRAAIPEDKVKRPCVDLCKWRPKLRSGTEKLTTQTPTYCSYRKTIKSLCVELNKAGYAPSAIMSLFFSWRMYLG